jgi:hypothetical protein
MIGVETKTMETGIMRMLGTNKRGLVTMVAIQSTMFVTPAILTAFALSFPMIALCYVKVFQEKLTEGFEPVPQPSAVIQALLVGITIPALSSILPILSVLGQNLNDALNFSRSRVKAVFVTITLKSKENTVPFIIIGVISFGYGLAIYYLLPLSLLAMNFSLILEVFFLILLGLLLGLTLLAINL